MSTFPSKYAELRPETRECMACLHPRLLHDSWGCVSRCGCQVGIVQITKNLVAENSDPEKAKAELALQNEAAVEQDRNSNKVITERLRGRLSFPEEHQGGFACGSGT